MQSRHAPTLARRVGATTRPRRAFGRIALATSNLHDVVKLVDVYKFCA
jgi:hypothetical protein